MNEVHPELSQKSKNVKHGVPFKTRYERHFRQFMACENSPLHITYYSVLNINAKHIILQKFLVNTRNSFALHFISTSVVSLSTRLFNIINVNIIRCINTKKIYWKQYRNWQVNTVARIHVSCFHQGSLTILSRIEL